MSSSLFITLTYPKDDPTATRCHEHLDNLLKRLRRKAPESSAIWKLEYTKNSTPHFHLLVLNLAYWNHKEIGKAWSEIVQSDHPMHELAGTQVQRIASVTHAARYMCKYIGKAGPLPSAHKGRIWGKSGSLCHAISQKKIFIITKEAYKQIRRRFDAIRKAQNRSKKFRRATNIEHRQRWFLRSPRIIEIVEAWKMQALQI